MHLVANITSYGGFSDDLATSQDWTPYDGFSFWFKGTNTGKSIEFEIKDGGTDGEHARAVELARDRRLDAVEARARAVLEVHAAHGLPAERRADRRQAAADQDVGLRDEPAVGPRGVRARRRAGLPAGRDDRGLRGRRTVGEPRASSFNGNNAPPPLSHRGPAARRRAGQPRAARRLRHAGRRLRRLHQQDFTDPQDWSAFAGFRFWFYGRPHGAAPGSRCNLEIKDGGTGPGASELWTTSFLDDTVGWHQVEIPFTQFTYRTDYQPVGGIDHMLDLTKMWGYAVTPPTSTGLVRLGRRAGLRRRGRARATRPWPPTSRSTWPTRATR